MPQVPTAFMLLVVPTEGGDDDVWDTLFTTLLGLVDRHDHTPNKGKPLVTASLVVDADWDFHGYRILDVGGVQLSDLAGPPVSGASEVYVTGGELWFLDGAGNHVSITDAGALTMTTVGGIGGNYTAVNALFAFIDASDSYTALQQLGAGVRQWARLESGDLRLYEYKAHPAAGPVPSTFVGLASPAALAASYTLTFPGALPGTTQLVSIDATGHILATNTIINAVTFSALTTHSAGATMAANQHVTVSGTGRYKHGLLSMPMNGGTDAQEWAGSGHFDRGVGYAITTGPCTLVVRIPLLVGQRLATFSFEYWGDGVADFTYEINVYDATLAKTTLGASGVNNAPAAWSTSSAGAVHVMATGEIATFELSTASAGIRLGELEFGYTWP